MRIDEIGGELGLIARLRETHAGSAGNGLIVPVGDDAAVIDVSAGNHLVVTTDMLVEEIHFRRDWSDPYSIGWKTAAVNLSDLAAMGASPTFAFLSVALTQRETVEVIERIYDGFVDCLNRYGARLAGGDTNSAPDHLVLSVTLLGTVPAGKALVRSGARVGDILLVTGALGDSSSGLKLLQAHGVPRAERVSKPLLNAHRRPQPRVFAGTAAMATGKVHAAMDISDGLLGDLQKLCKESNVGARLESSKLPLSSEMKQAAPMIGKEAHLLALEGGEDYELLFSVAPGDCETVMNAVSVTGTPITVVGEITKSGFRVIAPNGIDEISTEVGGYDHFNRA